MSLESLTEVLKDTSRPTFLFGSTPPREGTSIESAKASAKKFAERSAVLAIDGFIIYDIQDEEGRTTLERPFPFRKTIDSAEYASFFPPVSGKQCVVYKAVANESREGFEAWLNKAVGIYGHVAFNMVGAATSKLEIPGISLSEATALTNSKPNCSFGCVAIPERHTAKGNETINMIRKINLGCNWFITQGIFASEPAIQLIRQYGDLCREKGIVPKKIILTFAPCGRPKTMQFIKWLGMFVPEEAEKRIIEAAVPVKESLVLLKEILIDILEKTAGSGVPLGVNVESLSIFKEEIDAAHELFQILQATLLNHRGSPWSVRWFDLKKQLAFTASYASMESLQQLQQFYTGADGLPSLDQLLLESPPPSPSKAQSGNLVVGNENSEVVEKKEEISVAPTVNKHNETTKSGVDSIVLVAVSLLAGFIIGRANISR